MIVVTGATGQLGRLVVEQLLDRVPAGQIAVLVRDAAKAADLAARGVRVHVADYDDPQTLAGVFAPGDRVLLISGSELGRRVPQHTTVIEAAARAGVALLAYTSVLGGPEADFRLAAEHQATEEAVRAAGVPFTFLRNGWYTENYTARIGEYLDRGVIAAAAGDGRVASASRADFAAAAVAVLTGEGHENQAYELSGDTAWSLAEFAEELAVQSGRPVAYADVPPAELTAILAGAGLPAPVADILVDVDLAISRGLLARRNGDLARLIGRPTTASADTIREALTKA